MSLIINMSDRNKFNTAEQVMNAINNYISQGDTESIEQAAQLISRYSQEFFIQFYFDVPDNSRNQIPQNQ